MIEPIDIDPWAAKINAECPSYGNRAFATIPDDTLTIELHQSPLAFVYLASEQSEPNQMGKAPGVVQHSNHLIAVETVLRRAKSRDDPFEADLARQLRALRREAMTALLGWRPDDATRPVVHQSGKLKQKDKKIVKFVDLFATQSLLHGGF